ncbi:MAG: SpoIIE family protein phosphatase [Rubripirellula sp.]|nr:SpoIIE family protein phosphatase [Rubripirellula sp.]
MTKTIPDYLRLHGQTVPVLTEPPSQQSSLEAFWQSYSDVTGWRVDQKTLDRGEVGILPAVNLQTSEMNSEIAVSKLSATRLAEAANGLVRELETNREKIRQQEVELAARAPILGTEAARQTLSKQIDAILQRAVTGTGCQAAAIYLLDEDTQQLHCRISHGLPSNRIEQAPRSLRGSRGDLQAMVDRVVAISDLKGQDSETWGSPEPDYSSAICATIESDGVPVGTLWIFNDQRKDFSVAETTVAELSAYEIGERLRQASSEKQQVQELRNEPAQDLAQWQFESLPVGSLVASGWRVDGMLESPRPWAKGWHLWDILPDGTLMIVLAEAVDDSVKGAMTAALARAAVTAHTGYRHKPADLLQRVSDTLWQSSTAEQLLSLLYARIDPFSGEAELACAGSLQAVVGNRYGSRSVCTPVSDPLNTAIEVDPVVESFHLQPGETFLAYTSGLAQSFSGSASISHALQDAMAAKDQNPLARLRRQIAKNELVHERGAVSLLRE